MTNYNFKEKTDRKNKAVNWTRLMHEKYSQQIHNSIVGTYALQSDNLVQNFVGKQKYKTEIVVKNTDSVDAIFQESEKTCVLNFASYKDPGGLFIHGAMAQEEALCHESWLYNVLSSFETSWYADNKKRLNRALYHSNLLYSHDIGFFHNGKGVYADVITCAAPNKKAAQMYQHVSDAEVSKSMRERIDAILFAAYTQSATVLILGAFGCGVFGNNPKEVAGIFHELLVTKYHGIFKKIVFAIPGNGANYNAFVEEF